MFTFKIFCAIIFLKVIGDICMHANSVLKMLREHNGNQNYHPLCSLLDLADEIDATIPDKINIHKSIAKYIEAENKAIEFTGIGTADPIKLSILME